MIAEKAADMIREKDTVKPIKDYFKHLIATKHKKFVDEDEEQHHAQTNDDDKHEEDDDDVKKQAKKYKKNKKH